MRKFSLYRIRKDQYPGGIILDLRFHRNDMEAGCVGVDFIFEICVVLQASQWQGMGSAANGRKTVKVVP